eukprot:356953-Chlamydomonas_euryale.AAC.4
MEADKPASRTHMQASKPDAHASLQAGHTCKPASRTHMQACKPDAHACPPTCVFKVWCARTRMRHTHHMHSNICIQDVHARGRGTHVRKNLRPSYHRCVAR